VLIIKSVDPTLHSATVIAKLSELLFVEAVSQDLQAPCGRMLKPSRVELHKSADIPAPAGEVWSLLTDWAGMLRWRLNAEQGGVPGPALVKCELVGEHGAVPRARRMILNNGAVVEEQIFYQNDDTRRIYYSKSEPLTRRYGRLGNTLR
jgi:hypothetical protein